MEAENNQNEVSDSESRQSRYFLIGLVIAILAYLKREIWMGFHFHSQIAIYFILVGQFLFFSALDTNIRFKSFLKENLKYCVTYTWIAGCVVFLFLNFERLVKLELNSVGDMLAGMFAPLAMYWIIEAYRQQQKDFSHNQKMFEMSFVPNFFVIVSNYVGAIHLDRHYQAWIYSATKVPIIKLVPISGIGVHFRSIDVDNFDRESSGLIPMCTMEFFIHDALYKEFSRNGSFVTVNNAFSVIYVDLRGKLREKIFSLTVSSTMPKDIHFYESSDLLIKNERLQEMHMKR